LRPIAVTKAGFVLAGKQTIWVVGRVCAISCSSGYEREAATSDIQIEPRMMLTAAEPAVSKLN
jgi:hypothetical protein